MDIGKLLKNVHNLNEYIATTQDASEKCKTSKIQLNMSTVLALKKIRSLEIEYFNKCEENGIACVIFERMLCLPPSKTWGVLSKELVNLLQYWLDAVRKHLVRHNVQWWTFLKLLLRFVKEIRQKDASLPNILVEHTAECLLDLATNSRPDSYQRHEILHCFNMYCSESSREIRFALRNKFGQYFIKLATHMSSCGHLPTQYSIMETLLRWLLPRQDRTLRITSAAKWFPTSMYEEKDVDIFLERSWVNFFQDARDFLNAHNQRHDFVTSVVCRKLTVGKVVIISGTERQESWLDINLVSGCLSVLLDPHVLESFGSNNHKSFETLVVTKQNTHSAKLHKDSLQLLLSIRTVTPPQVLPSCLSLGDDVSCDVSAVVTTRCDVKRLDHALRKIFEDKYELSLDLDKELEQSPLKRVENSTHNKDSDEDPRFSHPVEVKRRKQSGYIVKPRQPVSCMSPSTASTSSLAQLHEKLAALPRYRYDKEPVSVCALPELSIVTELSETDDRQSLNTTLKFKPYGVCHKNLNALELESRKSQSDPESSRHTKKGRRLSPTIKEDTTSCLLVATIGSADDSVINDTVERLSKNKDYASDNIVDLLVQEALQAKDDRDKSDSGINTGEKKSDEQDNSETIDNTPDVDKIKLSKLPKKPKVVSSTDDESNTEVITETPSFVSTRRKNRRELKDPTPKAVFDEQIVEEFFSQHINENKDREITISPTFAKKINETSSETSDNFGENLNLNGEDLEEDIVPYDFNNIEVLECLNSIVDKVCIDFDKYLNKEDEITAHPNDSIEDDIPLKDILSTIQNIEPKKAETAKISSAKKKIKLKYKIKTPKKTKARATRRKNKLVIKTASKMSTIMEDRGLESAAESNEDILPPVTKEPEEITEIVKTVSAPIDAGDSKTPLSRRKRKLYSPKDEELAADSPSPPKDDASHHKSHEPEDDTIQSEIMQIKKTPKSKATCYKDIEKDRQRIRMPRARKSKVSEPPSPRTKKMNDVFDKVKDSANSEKVKLAENNFEADVYNFTSDSEDDFKVKKIEISKRNSTTTIASTESAVSKRGRTLKKINYTDNKSSDESNKIKRKVNRKPRTKKRVNVEHEELVDERMRQPKDVFNTSVVVENTKNTVTEPDLILVTAPEMEIIEDESNEKQETSNKKKGKKIKVESSESKRPKRVLNKAAVEKVINFDEDRTESPLPGLLVEPVTTNKDDTNDISATMVDKFRKIYQEGPDNYINESNTTQNLLSDVERINNSSPHNIDITEDLIQIEDLQTKDEPKPKEKSIKKKKSNSIILKNTNKKITPKKCIKENLETITIFETTDVKSEKSIATIGITGHGEIQEAPPSPQLITERLEPRSLEFEDLSHSMKDYFNKLTKEMNEASNRESNGSNDEHARKPSPKASSNKSQSPVVCVKRLSFEDISRWLPSRRNSDSQESYVSAKSAVKQSSKENVVDLVESPKIPEKKQDDYDSDVSEFNETIRKSLRLIIQSSQSCKVNNSGQTVKDSESESDSEAVKEIIKKLKATHKVVEAKKRVKTPEKTIIRKSLISSSQCCKVNNSGQTVKDSESESDSEAVKEIIKKPKATHKVVEAKKRVKTPEKTIIRKSLISSSQSCKVNNSGQTVKDSESESDSEAVKEIIKKPKATHKVVEAKKRVKTPEKTIIRKSLISSSQSCKVNNSGQTVKDSESESDSEAVKEIIKKPKATHKVVEAKKRVNTPEKTIIRKSLISPIKLFDELISNADKQSEKTLSDDEEYMKDIIYTLSKQKSENHPKMSQEKTPQKIIQPKKMIRTISSASSHSKISTSTKIEDSGRILKRRLGEERSDCKKRKVELNNNEELLSSGVTVSSVDDWFKRMEPGSSRTEAINASTRHIMQEVMERLDTTLVEIKRNTSKKFIHLFVDAQKHLSELKEKRRGMYSEVATDILSEVVKLMDSKFAGLNERLQELDDDFMGQLKQRSVELISEDCKHTKAMVRILKEDVQVVLDHMERQGTL